MGMTVIRQHSSGDGVEAWTLFPGNGRFPFREKAPPFFLVSLVFDEGGQYGLFICGV